MSHAPPGEKGGGGYVAPSKGLMSNPYKPGASGPPGYNYPIKTTSEIPKPITTPDRSGPVGATGDGRWNAGYDDDTNEKKHWDSIQNDKNRNRILNKTVENYNKPWLGTNAEWGNFEDDTKLTTAIKTGSNFLMRAFYAPVDITYAKFVGDPAANIYESFQKAGYIAPTGTEKQYVLDPITNTYVDPAMVIGGDAELTTFTQPSPVEFGTGVKTAAEIGTTIYYAPSIYTLGKNVIVGGYKKLQNFFKPKVPIKGNVVIDDLANQSVGASYKPQKYVAKLDEFPDGIPPEVEGYTGYVVLVNRHTGKEFSGVTTKHPNGGFVTNTNTHRWTDGKYYTGRYDQHFSNVNPAQPLDEVVVYHKNMDTLISRFDEQLPIKYEASTTDNSGVLLHHHLDEIYQNNQSFVEGVPIVTKWKHAENRLNNVIYENYIDTNSKLRIAYDKAGITPESNPSLFTYITRNGVPTPIPKITYHGTSKIFTDGLKGDKVKISSPDGSQFIGGTDNIEKTLAYIMDTEVLGTNIVQPRVYISLPIPKKTFDIGRNNEHLNFAIEHIANQRFNYWQGKKILYWDELNEIELPYQAVHNQSSEWHHTSNAFWKSTYGEETNIIKRFRTNTLDDWRTMVKEELLDNTSNWKLLEKEMRVFKEDGIVTPNHVLKDNGFDSFVTVEHAADPLYEFKGDMNIMIFEPEKNLLPISTVIDDLKPQKYSQFLSEQLQKPNVGYGSYRTIGQYMHQWESRPGMRPDIQMEKTGDKLLLELLGDAGDVIDKPDTPFDTDTQPSAYASFA